jgi:hypothetical protein
MNKPLCCVLILAACVVTMSAEPLSLHKGDRPVFVSVRSLATACEDWNAINPDGKPPRADSTAMVNVSVTQIARGFYCTAYILGYEDARLEGLGSHYHPVAGYPDYMKTLVDSFLKYAKDNPEKQDFAASTALQQVEEIIGKAQGVH